MIERTAKKIWKSRTIIFNALVAVVEVVDKLAGANIIPPNISIPVLIIGNALLRVLTKDKVTF